MKRRYTTASVYMKHKDGTITRISARMKIFLESKIKGIIVRDGRAVRKHKDRWFYDPKR